MKFLLAHIENKFIKGFDNSNYSSLFKNNNINMY